MGFLAVLCLIVGLAAGNIVTVLKRVISQLGGSMPAESIVFNNKIIAVGNGFSQLSMPYLVFGLLIMIIIGYVLTRFMSVRTKEVRDVTWDCGYTGLLPRTEITATGFSTSLITVFKELFRPVQNREVEYADEDSRYFIEEQTIDFKTINVFEQYLHKPLREVTVAFTEKITHIQGGSINVYILYIFMALIGLIIWVRYS